MHRTTLTAIMFMVLAGSGAAMADDACRLPMDQWQPREAVQKMAEARGWTVRRIGVDDGCYQIKGRDETGRAIKVKVDPGSLAIVKMRRESRDNRDDDDGASRRGSAGTVVPPSNGLFGDKTTPKVEMK
ncbi:MAG: PepSY domain-containing protein [Acetobacteraceae bacterium]